MLFTELHKHPNTNFYIEHFLGPFFYFALSNRFYSSVVFSVLWEILELIIFTTFGNYSALFLQFENSDVESNLDILILDIGGAFLAVSLAYMYFKQPSITLKSYIDENVLTFFIKPFESDTSKATAFTNILNFSDERIKYQWIFFLKVLIALPFTAVSCSVLPDVISNFEAAKWLFPFISFLINIIYALYHFNNHVYKYFIYLIVVLTHATTLSCYWDFPGAVLCLYMYTILVFTYYIYRYIMYLTKETQTYNPVNIFI